MKNVELTSGIKFHKGFEKVKSIEDALELTLLLLDLKDSPASYEGDDWNLINLKSFDGCELCSEHANSFMNNKESFDSQEGFYLPPGEVRLRDLSQEFNVKTLTINS